MKRFRVSNIEWDAHKNITHKKIPKVTWLELPVETEDIKSYIEKHLFNRFKIKPISFEYSDVTIDSSDMDMDEILRGMTPQD